MTLRWIVLGSLLAVSATLQGAGAQAQPADLFSQSVEVRVVNVDVHVADRKGRPITDLDKEDFRLLVDGQEVEVQYFRAARGAAPSPPQPEAPAEVATSEALPPVTRPVPAADDLLVVLYLDHYWLGNAERFRILDDLQEFIAAQEGTKMRFLVVSYDPGLNIRSPIMSDASVVPEIIAGLAEAPLHGDEMRRERSHTFRAIREIYQKYEGVPFCVSACECGKDEMITAWEVFAQTVTHRMQAAGQGLRDLLAALSGIPDRKAILYVAGGLEQRPALDILQYLSQICPYYERDFSARTFTFDESRSLLELGAVANASRATLYPLDAGGVRADAAASVEWADAKFRPSGLVTRIERENYQASLQILAHETGGRAIFNANHPFERLRQLENDFHFVYSLGFEPRGSADGKSHQVRVELRNPRRGAELRFRRAFIDRPLDRRLVDRAITAMTFGEERNPLTIRASLGEATQLARNVISLPVHVEVPTASLTLLPSLSGMPAGRFRVFLAARSARGARTVLREKYFDVGAAEQAEEVLRLIVRINLEPGQYTVAVGVRDEVGLDTSYLTLDTTDPSDRAPEPAVPVHTGAESL